MFGLLAVFGLYVVFADSALGGILDVGEAAAVMAVLSLLSHLPKLFELDDLVVFRPSVLAAQIVDEAVLVRVMRILVFY